MTIRHTHIDTLTKLIAHRKEEEGAMQVEKVRFGQRRAAVASSDYFTGTAACRRSCFSLESELTVTAGLLSESHYIIAHWSPPCMRHQRTPSDPWPSVSTHWVCKALMLDLFPRELYVALNSGKEHCTGRSGLSEQFWCVHLYEQSSFLIHHCSGKFNKIPQYIPKCLEVLWLLALHSQTKC